MKVRFSRLALAELDLILADLLAWISMAKDSPNAGIAK